MSPIYSIQTLEIPLRPPLESKGLDTGGVVVQRSSDCNPSAKMIIE